MYICICICISNIHTRTYVIYIYIYTHMREPGRPWQTSWPPYASASTKSSLPPARTLLAVLAYGTCTDYCLHKDIWVS